MGQAKHDVPAPAAWTLTALMLGNVVIGAGVLAPAALINVWIEGLGVTAAQVGALVSWGAVVLCIGAPSVAFVASRLDRRTLLVASLALYAIGHAASAAAQTLEQLFVIRLLMIGAAAVYTPQAASAVTLMIPPERRAGAVAYVFLGWSVATAAALPLMAIGGELLGWRVVFGALALAATLAALGVAWRTPRRLTPPPVSFADWRRTAADPAIQIVLLVTFIQVTGQFTLFPYLAAELKRVSGADAAGVALTLGLYGAAALVGAIIASRTVGWASAPRVQFVCLTIIAAGLGLWAIGAQSLWLAMAAVALWGLGFAAGVSMQQARLIAIAPAFASASVALNTSVLYLGQASGAAIGAGLIEAAHQDWLGHAGMSLMLVALLASWRAQVRYGA